MAAAVRALLAFVVVSALAMLIQRSGRDVRPVEEMDDAATLRSYLAAHPLAGSTYRRLGELESARGRADHAARLHAIAARRAPRDRASHAWLADHYSLAGNTAGALFHLDQLMRLQPRRAHHLFPSLGALLVTPASRSELVGFLGAAPRPWRAGFLRWFSTHPAVASLLDEVFNPLRTAPAPLTDGEREVWIERLLRERRNDQAYFLWIEGLPPERRQHIGNVYDGGFEFDGHGVGVFDWQVRPVAGAAVSRVAESGAGGRQALLVEFFDHRVPFEHLQQRLALPGGRYQFSGRVRSEDLRNERGLHWRLTCGTEVMAESEHFRGTTRWRDFQSALEVPVAPCAGQTLQLRLDARIRPEQMIGGRIWFDDLRIRRLD